MNKLSKLVSGSYLYGTNDDLSDRDYHGVYLPTKQDILLSKVKDEIKNKYKEEHLEETYFSLQFFVRLACQGQTGAMDMLHTPESMTMISSDVWKELVSLREKFYSKNIHAFLEYAKQQSIKYSLKGDRRKDLSDVVTLFKNQDPDYRIHESWYEIPRTKNIFEVEPTQQGIAQIFICGKIFQETARVGYTLPVLENLYNQYGERAKQAELNDGLDWKAISHAVRVLFEVEELLTCNTITFPLKEAKFVSNVKTGKENFVKIVSPLLESLTDNIDGLLKTSKLPDVVDEVFWENWLVNTLEKELFGKK